MPLNRRSALTGMGLTLWGAHTLARASPDRTLRIVVPFAPGGPGDFSARLAAVHLARELDQSVIVENKPGAGGNIGTQLVADAPPDGNTVLLNTVGMQAINPLLYPNLRFSPTRDFLTLGIVSVVPNVLVVHPSKLELGTLADLVELARRKPGQLSYATFGSGSSPHIYASLLLKNAGIEAVGVPYKGSAPASADVMAGNVDFLFDSMTTSLGPIQGKRLKGLALTSSGRSQQLPDIPTMQECGYPAVNLRFWLSLQIHARTPMPVVDKLRAALYRSITHPDYVASLNARGAEGLAIAPDQVHGFVLKDTEHWVSLGRQIDIRPV
ncbi:MAG: Bug family tripartite tricarboxylate transporter substrate binding protein [Comamonas sp.]